MSTNLETNFQQLCAGIGQVWPGIYRIRQIGQEWIKLWATPTNLDQIWHGPDQFWSGLVQPWPGIDQSWSEFGERRSHWNACSANDASSFRPGAAPESRPDTAPHAPRAPPPECRRCLRRSPHAAPC